MKNIFIIITLLIGWGSVNGQAKKTITKNTSAGTKETVTKKESNSNTAEKNKPSLEETINYINDIVAASMGVYRKSRIGTDSTVTRQEFSKDKILIESKLYDREDGHVVTTTEIYSKILWNYLEEDITIKDSESLKKLGILK